MVAYALAVQYLSQDLANHLLLLNPTINCAPWRLYFRRTADTAKMFTPTLLHDVRHVEYRRLHHLNMAQQQLSVTSGSSNGIASDFVGYRNCIQGLTRRISTVVYSQGSASRQAHEYSDPDAFDIHTRFQASRTVLTAVSTGDIDLRLQSSEHWKLTS